MRDSRRSPNRIRIAAALVLLLFPCLVAIPASLVNADVDDCAVQFVGTKEAATHLVLRQQARSGVRPGVGVLPALLASALALRASDTAAAFFYFAPCWLNRAICEIVEPRAPPSF